MRIGLGTDAGTFQEWMFDVDCPVDQWPRVRQELCVAVDKLINRQLDAVDAAPPGATCYSVQDYAFSGQSFFEGGGLSVRVQHYRSHDGPTRCTVQRAYAVQNPRWKDNWKKPFAEVEPGELMQIRRAMIDQIRNAKYEEQGKLLTQPVNLEAVEPADLPFVRTPKRE